MDLKKLGIQNSKDRTRMLSSLANYKADREDTTPSEYQLCIEGERERERERKEREGWGGTVSHVHVDKEGLGFSGVCLCSHQRLAWEEGGREGL